MKPLECSGGVGQRHSRDLDQTLEMHRRFGQRHSVRSSWPCQVQPSGSQWSVVFLGTLNQTNKRNWPAGAVGLADSCRLLSSSLLLWNSFFLWFSVSLWTGSSSASK